MTAPEGNPTTPLDPGETVVSPRAGESADSQQTIDLRDRTTVDLRDTTLVPAQGGHPVPPAPPAEIMRFGPGVPAVIAIAPGLSAAESAAPPRRLRRDQALNLALTLALAAVVVWLLWPAGALRVRAVTVTATPSVVACEKSADVVATVQSNGNPGRLTYRWTRNDGIGSGTLVQSLARGQHSVKLHLTWAFHGPGTYDARAAVQVLSPGRAGTPGTPSATVNFRYVC